MKKRHSGRRFGVAAVLGIMLLCITAWGLTSCEDELAALAEANKITSFKVGNVLGAIDEETQTIVVFVPTGTDLQKLTPIVTVSSSASLFPESGTEVDIRHPVSYTVTAENGVSRTYKVTVNAEDPTVTLNSIAIRTLPTRTIYEVGETFDPSGMVVVGVYSDQSVREETEYTLNPSPVLTEDIGALEVTVSVRGKPATFTVTVRDARLESITVATLKDSYAYGEELDPAGIAVTGHYSDGRTETEVSSSYGVTGYDPEKSGSQTLLVTLNRKTATFTVTVGYPDPEVTLSSISVTTLKGSYAYGEELDPAGIVVRGFYSNGTDKIEAPADETTPGYTVSGHNPEKPGYQTLLVTLGEKTATVTVTVGTKPVERDISVSIGLPNTNKEPEIFGIPEGGIKLSTSQNGLPNKIVISAANFGSVYSNVTWYVDGSLFNNSNNIITIEAVNYTLKLPHYITFTGTKDNIEYSRTITFTVER
jgi:hypothetical protein